MRTDQHPGSSQAPAIGRPPGGLRAALVHVDPRLADAAFARLARDVFDTAAAGPVDVVGLTGVIAGPPHPNRARVAVLLGVLAGADASRWHLPGLVRDAVLDDLDAQLAALVSPDASPSLRAALRYLFAHLPEARERVLPALRSASGERDLSRVQRCLAEPDFDDLACVAGIGRGWPSPAQWRWRAPDATDGPVLERSRAELGALWDSETAALRAYLGARAEHEIHRREGWPDLAGLAVPEFHPEPHGDYRALLEQDQLVADHYETVYRPASLELMGGNWDELITVHDEDAYLRRSLRAAPGPVLDLACGRGRWTRVIAEQVGPDRVLGLDLSAEALRLAREAVPGVRFAAGDARALPFPDAFFGAVNCSDALHLLPDPEQVIAEAARCLHPAGTLTVTTFRPAARPLQRHLQRWHERVFGLRTFDPPELADLLAAAGLDVVDASGPGCLLFLTARRRAAPRRPATLAL